MRESAFVFLGSFFAWLKRAKMPKFHLNRTIRHFKDLITKNNIRYAIKTAIAVVLSYVIADFVEPEYSFWAPISAIIVMQVSVAASISSSLDRIAGSLFGAVLGLVAHFIFPMTVLGANVGLFVIACLCAVLLLVNPKYRLAGITGITIFLVSPIAVIQNVWHFSGVFLFHIILSIVIALLVSVLIWPVSGAESLRQSLKKQYLMAADSLEAITLSFLNEQNHLPPTFLDALHDAVPDNRTHFRQVKEYEAINIARHYADLDVLLVGLEHTTVYLASLLDALDSEAEPIKELPLKEELMSLASSAASGLRWIASHSDDQTLPEVRWHIEAVFIRLADLRNENILKKLTLPQLVQVLAFYNAMNHLSETVANLEEQIEIISRRNDRANKRKRLRKFFAYFNIMKLFKKEQVNDRD